MKPVDEATLRALDLNFAWGNFAWLATSTLGNVAEDGGVWLWSCGLPVADFNVAFPKAPVRDLDACLARAEAFFAPRDFPWRVTARRELAERHGPALVAAGFEEGERFPAMTLGPLPEPRRHPPGLEVREVAGPEDLARFQDTAFRGFGLPGELGGKFITEAFLALPHARMCLGLVDGEPVCTAAVVMSGELIGVYWVATLESHRGRGLGEAITWAAIEMGRRRGGTWCCLQASALGRPVYERMGFATPTEYVRFERPK